MKWFKPSFGSSGVRTVIYFMAAREMTLDHLGKLANCSQSPVAISGGGMFGTCGPCGGGVWGVLRRVGPVGCTGRAVQNVKF